MPIVTVPIADEDLAFLREWSERQGTSVEALLARQAHQLRQNLQKPLHPDVEAAIGIISADADEDSYRDYLDQKHA